MKSSSLGGNEGVGLGFDTGDLLDGKFWAMWDALRYVCWSCDRQEGQSHCESWNDFGRESRIFDLNISNIRMVAISI